MAKAPKKAGSPPRRKRAKTRPAEREGQRPETQEADAHPPAQPGPEQVQHEAPPSVLVEPGRPPGAEVLDRLWALIEGCEAATPEVSTSHVAQAFGEQAVECVIAAMAGDCERLIEGSADLLYLLLVAWLGAGIRPEEVWHELHRRERLSSRRDDVRRKRAIKRVIGRTRAKVGTTKIP